MCSGGPGAERAEPRAWGRRARRALAAGRRGDAAVCEVPAARLARGDLCAEEHRLINTKRSSLLWVTEFRLCSFLRHYTLKYIKCFCILFWCMIVLRA